MADVATAAGAPCTFLEGKTPDSLRTAERGVDEGLSPCRSLIDSVPFPLPASQDASLERLLIPRAHAERAQSAGSPRRPATQSTARPTTRRTPPAAAAPRQ